ncbi:HPr family phosphocarrier protein [Microbispora sp. ATCC PTA-5024]|uniref:HPr family phosphocarrier protein n=1 Tax=Microbispora sp. ATCC PTA-5024 TaxID=316330 RepID=UPI0004210F1A|nr:HPr family phosphocarrier protein [Microbispora sp. ATCC PTA-5024]
MSAPPEPLPETAERSIVLTEDLHARPASTLAQVAAAYVSSVTISYGSRAADVRSVLSVMSLGATGGGSVTLRATGPDAPEALAALGAVLGA